MGHVPGIAHTPHRHAGMHASRSAPAHRWRPLAHQPVLHQRGMHRCLAPPCSADALLRKGDGDGSREGDHPRLAGRRRHVPPHPDPHPGHRRDVHDRPAALRLHDAATRICSRGRRVFRLKSICRSQTSSGMSTRIAGMRAADIVHQDVDPAEPGQADRDRGLDLSPPACRRCGWRRCRPRRRYPRRLVDRRRDDVEAKTRAPCRAISTAVALPLPQPAPTEPRAGDEGHLARQVSMPVSPLA